MSATAKPRGTSRRQFLSTVGAMSGATLLAALTMPTTTFAASGAAMQNETVTNNFKEGATDYQADYQNIQPFTVKIPQKALHDLRRRLAETRWPSQEPVADPSQGVQLAPLQALVRYWATEYDWRKTEKKLNALPHFTTTIDGVNIHFIHVKSRHENALPLLITHGWPGSIIELLGIIGPLTDPTAYGGKAEDAFHVVIPSIPGYGFSAQPTVVGWGPGRVAVAWGVLMNRLGYTRYVAQGGDVGASVTDAMGRLALPGLLGIHLNLLGSLPPAVAAVIFGRAPLPPDISAEERAAYAGIAAVFRRGYYVQQNEHPQTIGYAQADSPAGLAAWMLDHDPDSYTKIASAFLGGPPAGGLTRESIVDNIALYWLTNTGVSASRMYWETTQALAAAAGKPIPPMALPGAYTVFPQEVVRIPRSWVEQVFPNLIYFNEVDRGGHFAAWEEPQIFAEELRAAFRSLRLSANSVYAQSTEESAAANSIYLPVVAVGR